MSEILAHVENSQAFDAASRSKSFYLARRLGLSSVGVKSRPGCRENPSAFRTRLPASIAQAER